MGVLIKAVSVGGADINEQAQFADLNREASNSQEITKDIERGGLDTELIGQAS